MTDEAANDRNKSMPSVPAIREIAKQALVRRGIELAGALQRAARHNAEDIGARSSLALDCINEAQSFCEEATTLFWNQPDSRKALDAICRGFLWLVVAGIDILEVTSPPLTIEQTNQWVEAALATDCGGMDQVFNIAQNTVETLLKDDRLKTDVTPFARELRDIMVIQVESECSMSDEMLDSLAIFGRELRDSINGPESDAPHDASDDTGENRARTDIEVLMPRLGADTATLVRWTKQVGDPVTWGEVLFEISTEIVDAEIPSQESGAVTKIHVQTGATVRVHTVVGVIQKPRRG
jgi:biotin carboxyl carrier protein